MSVFLQQPSVAITLDLVSGADTHPKRSFELAPDSSMPIGRASHDPSKRLVAGNDNCWLSSQVVSRSHARVSYRQVDNVSLPLSNSGDRGLTRPQDYKVVIEDVGSTHGTYVGVNTTQVTKGDQQVLEQGDTIQFGLKMTRENGESPSSSSNCFADIQDSADYNPPIFTMSYVDNVTPLEGAQSRSQGYGYSTDDEDIDSIDNESTRSSESDAIGYPTDDYLEDESPQTDEDDVRSSYSLNDEEDDEIDEEEDDEIDEIDEGESACVAEEQSFEEYSCGGMASDNNPTVTLFKLDPHVPREESVMITSSQTFMSQNPLQVTSDQAFLQDWYTAPINQMSHSCSLGMPLDMGASVWAMPEPQMSGAARNQKNNSMAIPSLLNGSECELASVPEPLEASQTTTGYLSPTKSRKRKIIVIDDDDEEPVQVKATMEHTQVTNIAEDATKVVQTTTTNLFKTDASSSASLQGCIKPSANEDIRPAKRSKLWSVASHVGMALAGSAMAIAGLAFLPDGSFLPE
jgi:FHA domain